MSVEEICTDIDRCDPDHCGNWKREYECFCLECEADCNAQMDEALREMKCRSWEYMQWKAKQPAREV